MNLLEKSVTFIKDNLENLNEKYRPEFHLAPEYGWMNDPNGFVFYKGEYHLFYQSNPYDSKWDTMHWGHAKSKDLMTWEHLPMAIAPDQPYDKDGCFSGSAIVVDDELVLMYTGVYEEDGVVNQVQCIATSTDGINFTKPASNPVIGQSNLGDLGTTVDFRDPKVFKRNDTYYVVVASKTIGSEKTQGQIFIFTSENLIDWSQASVLLEGNDQLGNIWECPDLFELDGHDVLVMSPMNMPQVGNQYQNINSSIAMIGEMDWDNLSFKLIDYHEIDQGLDYYAPQTCLDDQGRRIIVAWQQMWGRTSILDLERHGWSGMMTLPRVLSVSNGQLVQTIPEEFYNRLELVLKEDLTENLQVENKDFNYVNIESEEKLEDLSIVLGNDQGKHVLIELNDNKIFITRNNVNPEIKGEKTYTNDRQMDVSDLSNIELIIDSSSIEVVASGRSMSNTVYFEDPINNLQITSKFKESKTVTLSKID